MVHNFFFFLLLFVLLSVSSQENSWDAFLSEVQKAPVEKKQELIESFLQSNKNSFPLAQETKIIFVYIGKAQSVSLAGDFNGWKPTCPMAQIPQTDLWYVLQDQTFSLESRFEYQYVVDGNKWILDPLNPRKDIGGYGYKSDLWMPLYSRPAWLDKEPEQKGTIQSFTIDSEILKNSRRLQVYTPYQYDPQGSYPLLVVHDGSDYISMAYATKLLDLLIQEKRITPLVAAFIDPIKRFEEYACSEKYYEFTKTELVPFVEKNFSITPERSQRAFAGASMGGLVSFYLAYKMNESFGKALCQSGAFIFKEMEAEKEGPKIIDAMESIDYSKIKDSCFWLDCGSIGPLEELLLKGNIILQDRLDKNGIRYSYRKLPEAHNWGSWRKILEPALITLFPFQKE